MPKKRAEKGAQPEKKVNAKWLDEDEEDDHVVV